MHYLGFIGVPRRYYAMGETEFIPQSAQTLNEFITVAALIVGFAQVVFIFNLVWSLFKGKHAGTQPLAGHHARVANTADAARTRQLGQGVAGGLPLGLRLQRAGSRSGLPAAEPSARSGRHRQGPRGIGRPGSKAREHLPSADGKTLGGGTGQGRRLSRGGTFALPTAKLALRVFLAVVTVLFTLLIIAYGTRMEFEDWRPTPQLRLLWLNTAMLVLSSLAMQWAQFAARRGEIDGVWIGLLAGGVFRRCISGRADPGLAATEYAGCLRHHEPGDRLLLSSSPRCTGCTCWAASWPGAEPPPKCGAAPMSSHVRLSVELCTVYWHFLLLVWLVLFGLLFSGNDNLGILLSICGLR